jgi:hypothetical protein
MVNLASRAKEDIKAAADVFTASFSSDRQARERSSADLASYAESKAIDTAAAGYSAAIVAMMPRRNEYNDPGFSAFFEAAQTATTGAVPSAPGIQFIQRTAGGVLESLLQQTLGDMDQLQRDINSFSAGGTSYYPTRPTSIGGRNSSSVSASRSSSGDSTAAPTLTGTSDLAREEVEAVRQGLRYAMTETRTFSPSLARFAGMDALGGGRSGSSCKDPERGTVADGRRICREGRAMVCRGGQLQPTGDC